MSAHIAYDMLHGIVPHCRDGVEDSRQGREEHGSALKVVLAQGPLDQIQIAETYPCGNPAGLLTVIRLFRLRSFVPVRPLLGLDPAQKGVPVLLIQDQLDFAETAPCPVVCLSSLC